MKGAFLGGEYIFIILCNVKLCNYTWIYSMHCIPHTKVRTRVLKALDSLESRQVGKMRGSSWGQQRTTYQESHVLGVTTVCLSKRTSVCH